MSKRILILGAGSAQIDAIEYCKARGYEVAGCSYTNTDSGIPYLDYFEQIDIKDVKGVAALAEKYGASVIYSVGSDIAMPTVMKASEMLGLPHFISHETAEICHCKNLMRETLGHDFRGNVPFIVASSLEEALEGIEEGSVSGLRLPAMMKPVDSQGQRGCFKITDRDDIISNFAASLDYSHSGQVIIEEYIEGPEISVNAYMQNGELRFALVSDRYVFDEYPGGIIKEHRVPSTFADQVSQDKAADLTSRVAGRLGVDNGPLYLQIKLRADGEPMLLEVTPRLDGCHMWRLIKHYCGADLLDACFTHLLTGAPVLTEHFDFPERGYRLTFMSQETGSVFQSNRFDTTGAEYVRPYYADGDTVGKVNGYIEKCGYIISAI